MSDMLITDLVHMQCASQAQAEENLAFRTFVNIELPLSDRQLNALVQATTARVWEGIDCRTCANCCKTSHPLFTKAEVERIAAHLGTTAEDVRTRYLESSAAGKYTTREHPCPFLQANLCTIYPVRPAVCAGYPHLQRNFRSRLWKVIDDATVCPIVYNVLERLKKQFGFGEPTS